MNKTKIEWCDYTWNPIVGCSPISAGCKNCYAAAISKRFNLPWGSAHYIPERLTQPLDLEKPSRIFVCSMGDFFHHTVKTEWKHAVFNVVDACPQHTFIFLTKRPGSIASFWIPHRNIWIGVTVENQEAADHRIPIFYKARLFAQVRFISAEPLLGPITLKNLPIPDWVIAGPETGPGARPCDDKWINDLAAESLKFFDKRKAGWMRREFPE